MMNRAGKGAHHMGISHDASSSDVHNESGPRSTAQDGTISIDMKGNVQDMVSELMCTDLVLWVVVWRLLP